MVRSIVAMIVAFGCSGPTVAADEAYGIKLYKSKTGDKIEIEKRSETKTSSTIGGRLAEAKKLKDEYFIKSSSKETYTEEVLEKKMGARQPTRLTRAFTTCESTAHDMETAPAVYANDKVLIENKAGKYRISVGEKELKAADAPALFGEFDGSDLGFDNADFLPKAPVKIGESWEVPAAIREKVYKSLGTGPVKIDVAVSAGDGKGTKGASKIDVEKSKVGGKLLKAYKKDGAQYGHFELTIAMFVTEISMGDLAKTVEGSKIVYKYTFDSCIDGTDPFEDTTLEISYEIAVMLDGKNTILMCGTTKSTEKTRSAKK